MLLELDAIWQAILHGVMQYGMRYCMGIVWHAILYRCRDSLGYLSSVCRVMSVGVSVGRMNSESHELEVLWRVMSWRCYAS